MDNTILCWNVRGLNDRARRDAVRTLVDDIRPSVVCLQETKLDVIQQHLVLILLILLTCRRPILEVESWWLQINQSRASRTSLLAVTL
jgi:hypothetical protein